MRLAPLVVVLLLAAGAAQATLIDDGREALARNQVDTAVTLLQRAVTEQPDSADAHYWLGNAYGRMALKANVFRRFSLAKKTRQEFEKAVALNPDDIDARFALVQFYTMAPAFVGGSEAKAYSEACEIQSRNPDKGKLAVEFVQTHGRSAGMPQSPPADNTSLAQSGHHH